MSLLGRTLPPLLAGFVIAAWSTEAAHAETTITLGAAVGVGPDYTGSDDYEAGALPMVKLDWTGGPGRDQPVGIRLDLGLHDVAIGFPDGLDVGLLRVATPFGNYMTRLGVAYGGGRDDGENPALRGMGDIDSHLLGRVSFGTDAVEGRPSPWFHGVAYQFDPSNETDADTLDVHLGYALPLSETLTLTTIGNLLWADADYMKSYFGVSRVQASKTAHRRFEAESGIAAAGLNMTLGYRFGEGWSLSGGVGYTRLFGDAADSPLVDASGSPDQFTLNVGLAYSF